MQQRNSGLTPLVIVAARMTSERLPGKCVQKLGDDRVIVHCLKRCMETGLPVMLAIPDHDRDSELYWVWHQLSEENWKKELYLFSGDKDDVLNRLTEAAQYYSKVYKSVECVIRVTGDCPFADPKLIKFVVDEWRRYKDFYPIASNVFRARTFAKGLDVEIVDYNTLVQFNKTTYLTPEEREHVTMGMYLRMPEKVHWIINPGEFPDQHSPELCVDTQEDLERLRTYL